MFVDTPAKIAVLGAGPIGLEAALYARFLGYEVDIFEAGAVAENVLRWGQVRMFSPFRMNASPLGLAALSAQDDGYQPPGDEELLTAREWVEGYLLPLAQSDLLVDGLHTNTRVLGVSRLNCLKGERIGESARTDSPLRLLLATADGQEQESIADIVIDTTGVFGNHNWLGRGGLPAIGEREAAGEIEYGLPNVLGAARGDYADKHTLVVGGGYSAATNVVALAELAKASPQTQITWITRVANEGSQSGPISRIENDRLASRDALAQAANALTQSEGCVTHQPGAVIDAVDYDPESKKFSVKSSSHESQSEQSFDKIIANVGFRPDASLYAELQVHQCYATEGPMKLAAVLLGQTSADCLDQTSAGPAALLNPEPNFYILGSKSYGRKSNFLVSLGLEQVRDLFTIIGGREDLDLYAGMGAASSGASAT